jgi:ABC-type nitrate/sulfonate/bicarbonate transport system substrate-binding protein
MKTLVLVLFTALVVTFLPGVDTAVSEGKLAGSQAQLDTITLKLKWKHQFQFAGYYAAIQQGYYRDAGLDVRLEEASDQQASVDAVLNNKAEFGIASSDLVVLRGNGKPVVALAAIFQHSPNGLLAKKNKGIENIHDVLGKRVMLEPQSDEILAYLRAEGISSNQLILYPHTFDPLPLINDEVDVTSAYITDEPFLLEEAGVPYNFFSPRAGGIDFYGDTLFTSEEQIRKHPDRVSAFLHASMQGWEYAFRNEDAVIDLILSQYSTRHTREHLKYEAEQMRKLVLPDIVEAGYMNPGRWERIAETYVDLGTLAEKPQISGFLYKESPKHIINWFYMIAGGIIAIVALLVLLGLANGLGSIFALGRKLLARGRQP